MKHRIDALMFKIKKINKQKKYANQYDFLPVSNGFIRFIDTRIGEHTLLIIPDIPNIIEHYNAILEELKNKFRVVIFELPGIGYSYHNGLYDYSFKHTNKLITEILQTLNIHKINIAFPCANGFYGLSFAKEFPEKVDNIFLLQTPSLPEMFKWSEDIIPKILRMPYVGQIAMPIIEKRFIKKWYKYALPRNKSKVIDKYKNLTIASLAKGASFCLCSLTQGILNEGNCNLSVDKSIPITLIYGDNDFTHQKTDFNSIREYGKDIEIIKFDNCGHFPGLENPTQFLKILESKIL